MADPHERAAGARCRLRLGRYPQANKSFTKIETINAAQPVDSLSPHAKGSAPSAGIFAYAQHPTSGGRK